MKQAVFFTLIVVAFGLSCHLEKLGDIDICQNPPVASFAPNSANCAAPCTITLTNSSINATKYKWNFGDGTLSSAITPPSHIYNTPGNYSISLIAQNDEGCSDTATQTINIVQGLPVIASFTFDLSQNGGIAPCSVKFTNTSSNAMSYAWNFGDGGSSNEVSPEHLYTKAGEFQVTLTATGLTGNNEKILSLKIKTITFKKTFGTVSEDQGYALTITPDGNYVIAGNTRDNAGGSTDMYVLKVDASGNQIWASQSNNNKVDFGVNITQTLNGRYYGISNTTVNELGYDITKSTLTTIYGDGSFSGPNYYPPPITIGVPEGRFAIGVDYPTFDGKVMIITSSGLLKVNDPQNQSYGVVWEQIYSGGVRGFQKTADNGFILVSGGPDKITLRKVDENGNSTLSKTYSISGFQDQGNAVQPTSDGGYIILGTTKKIGEYPDVVLLKTDNNGVIVHQKIFGGAGPETAEYRNGRVRQTSDGGFIFVCTTNSFGAGESDIYVVKVDSSLQEQWWKVYGGAGNEIGCDIQQVSDGGYIIVGYTNSFGSGSDDVYLIKTDIDGEVY